MVKETHFVRTFWMKALLVATVCFLAVGFCACGNEGDEEISDTVGGYDAEDTEVDTEEDTEADTEVDTEEDTEADTEVDTEEDTEADTEVDTEEDTEADTEVDTEEDTEADTEVDTEEDTDTDSDTEETEPSGETFFLNSPALDIRFFGEREVKDGIYYSCNYPGSGFESKFKSNGGAVSVKALTDKECSFLVYLDGELQKNADGGEKFTVNGDGLISLSGISAGEHTLKLVRASGFGAKARLYGLVLSGEMLEAGGSDEERSFIEFIGDGINSKVSGTTDSERVDLTYSYLLAEKLNADYSITSYNSNGLVCTSKTINDLYGIDGGFTRKADIAVINVGELDILATGDKAVDASAFRGAYEELAMKVRAVNGGECKILMICTSGNAEFAEAIEAACDSLGGGNKGYFFKDISGSAGIPHTEDEHKAYVEAIEAAIEEIKDYKIQTVKPEQSGTGDSIAMDSSKWGEF